MMKIIITKTKGARSAELIDLKINDKLGVDNTNSYYFNGFLFTSVFDNDVNRVTDFITMLSYIKFYKVASGVDEAKHFTKNYWDKLILQKMN